MANPALPAASPSSLTGVDNPTTPSDEPLVVTSPTRAGPASHIKLEWVNLLGQFPINGMATYTNAHGTFPAWFRFRPTQNDYIFLHLTAPDVEFLNSQHSRRVAATGIPAYHGGPQIMRRTVPTITPLPSGTDVDWASKVVTVTYSHTFVENNINGEELGSATPAGISNFYVSTRVIYQ